MSGGIDDGYSEGIEPVFTGFDLGIDDKSISVICGWFFEVHASSGPWPLKKDGELRERAGNVFYSVYEKFDKLSDEEKLKYRVGGWCIPIGPHKIKE